MYRNARAEMIRAGLNLDKVAKAMGKKIATISNWLNGKQAITFENAVAFKKVVKSDLPLEVLFEKFEEVG